MIRRLVASLRRGAGGASLGSAVSAALGLARDALILRALGVTEVADRYFLTFLTVQLVFLVLLGGTRFVEVQGFVASQPHQWHQSDMRRLWAGSVRSRAAVGAAISGAIGFLLASSTTISSKQSALIGLLVGAAIWIRGKAEYRTLFLQAEGVFGWASLAVAGQNLGVVLGAVLALALRDDQSAAIWAGVTLGYSLHWFLVAAYRQSEPEVVQSVLGAERALPAMGGMLNVHLLVTQLPLVAEQAALNIVGTGLGALIGVARRFTGAVNSVFLVPLGTLVLVNASRGQASPNFTERAWSALYLFGVLSIAASLWLFYGLSLSPGFVTAFLRITEDHWVLLLTATAVAIPSATFQAAHAVLSRGSHAVGRTKGPLKTAIMATAVHSVGIILILMGAQPMIALVGAACGWTMAAQFEGRRFREMYGAPSIGLRAAILPAFAGLAILAVLAAGVAGGLGSLRGSIPVGVAALVGLVATSLLGGRAAFRSGDLGWL